MKDRKSSIDEVIRQAMREGKFENLSGKGKPLNLANNAFEDPEWGPAYHIIKSHGFCLPWMEKRKGIEVELEAARNDLMRSYRYSINHPDGPNKSHSREWTRAVDFFRDRVLKLNQRIRDYNLEAPSTQFHFKTIHISREIGKIQSMSD